MEVKRIAGLVACVFLFAFSYACSKGSKGTEVVNPQDIIPPFAAQAKYTNSKYLFSLDVSAGWSVTEFDSDNPPSADLYSDPLGTAEAVALFEYGDIDLLVLAEYLGGEESLVDYIKNRLGDDVEMETRAEDGEPIVTVKIEESARDVFFSYKAIRQDISDSASKDTFAVPGSSGYTRYLVLTFRIEIPTSYEGDAEALLDEIVNSASSDAVSEEGSGSDADPWSKAMLEGGDSHSLFLELTGYLNSWGRNSTGELGLGFTSEYETTVTAIAGFNNISKISAAESSSIALKTDGTVWVWGSGRDIPTATFTSSTPIQVEGISAVTDVEKGAGFSIALKSDGTLWSWGDNGSGRLGTGSVEAFIAEPAQVPGLTNVIAFSTRNDHTLAVKSDGTVSAWGNGASGVLGNGTTINRSTPVSVSGLANIIEVSASTSNSMALSSDGRVFIWGSASDRMLGEGVFSAATTPIEVAGLDGVTDISLGENFAMVLRSDGTVWTWGSDTHGEIGGSSPAVSGTPHPVPGLANVIKISAGYHHALVLQNDGTVQGWGWNQYGQLGEGEVGFAESYYNAPKVITRFRYMTEG